MHIGASKTILSWINFGVTWKFDFGIPTPCDFPEIAMSDSAREGCVSEMKRFFSMGCFEPLAEEERDSACIGFIFSVPKKDKPSQLI